jgi:maleamate amidohydrolase
MATLEENYRGVFHGRVGFGERPALLLIDFVKGYTTPGSPLYAPAVAEAARATRPLLAAARARGVPAIFTRVQYHSHGADGGWFLHKVPALRALVAGAAMGEIVDELRPEPEDLVLVKNYASAFFGTTLAATLVAQRIDTLILAGCSTSGCVRATAVDGMQHGFRVIVPRECVGDRRDEPHQANLFDIDAKYGDVVAMAEALANIEAQPQRTQSESAGT